MTDEIDRLRREIAERESELADLRSQLAVAESERREADGGAQTAQSDWKWPLREDEYERYSRQMIVPNFGLQGQLRLRDAKVLLVGAGGLGCPAAAYLAGAGVGVLGLVDGDTVEASNLHRQIAHATSRVGMPKVESAITYLKELNPTITYRAHPTHLTPQNAASILSRYDLVLDCTDHPTSRYLISDACVLLRKPLVSASAFQSSGQLLRLNHPVGRGPCYRCVFPRPPPPESVVGCGEGGIVGPVVGAVGVLQALEAIKLITQGGGGGGGGLADDADAPTTTRQPSMLIFSAMATDAMFRTVRLRGRRDDCFACGTREDALTMEQMQSSLDYVQFCGVAAPVRLLRPAERVPAAEYARIAADRAASPHLLIDVREKEHFGLSSIPGSVNVPISRFMRPRAAAEDDEAPPDWIPADLPHSAPIYVVCRVGNDSQVAAQKLKELGLDRNGERFVGDIDGGLRAWRNDVDPTLPFI